MSLFVIADLHLPFSVNKPMDIFDGWNNYAERLKHNWQHCVKQNDIVVLPGDFSWAMKLEDAYDDFKFLSGLNGIKILSKGNHDYWWNTVGKMEKFLKSNDFDDIFILHNNCYSYGRFGICGTRGWISENGEQTDKKILLREAQRLETSIASAESKDLEPLVFLHYPPIYLDGENKEILDVLKRHNVKECFYGHIHGKKKHMYAVKGKRDGINYHLVSSDFLQFMPLNITKIVQNDE